MRQPLHHQWADHYDRELNDIFAVQDEITRNVTVEMRVHLTEGEQARMRAGGTENVEAWEHMVRGMELCSSHVREDNLEAQRLLAKALQLDDRYAAAWTWLGWAHWEDSIWGWGESREESLDQALKCAQTAIELESTHPDGLGLLSGCYMSLGRHDDALLTMEQAIRFSPNHSYNIASLSLLLRVVGRVEDSLRR